jgi:hypothetical protein
MTLMRSLSDLECAVLREIARQVPDHTRALESQLAEVRVVARENTDAWFFTTLSVASVPTAEGLKSPVGDVGATVAGLQYGMGFLLWLENGLIHILEGYSYGEDGTTDLDFETVSFNAVGPRA